MELKESIEKCKKYTQNSLDIWAIPSSYECEELRIAINTVLEELNNRIPKERINEQIRFLNDEGYFEFNTKRDLEKATKILNNLLNKE